MKILVVNHHYSHGGSIKMLTWLANKLADFNYEVIFCCTTSSEKDMYYKLNDNIKVINGNLGKNNIIVRNTIELIREYKLLKKVINNNNPDLVISFVDHSFYNVKKLKKKYKFKLLLSQRIDPNISLKLTDRIKLKSYKKSDGLVVQTPAVYDFFDYIDKNNKRIIYNPANLRIEERWQLNNCEDYIINVARLNIKQKRQDLLIDAFKIIHKKYPSLKLKLFGKATNNDLAIIKNKINELELNGYVEYCGESRNIYKDIARAKALILSSDFEGIPNSIIESMVIGTPVVSTDCKPDGARMLIPSDDFGLVVERGRDDLLAEAILKILDNDDLKIKISDNARKRIEIFSEDKIINQWIDFIEKIVSYK